MKAIRKNRLVSNALGNERFGPVLSQVATWHVVLTLVTQWLFHLRFALRLPRLFRSQTLRIDTPTAPRLEHRSTDFSTLGGLNFIARMLITG